MTLVPGNYSISMATATATATENAYIKMSNHPKAADILEVLAKERPKDPDVWFLLVESQSKDEAGISKNYDE